MNRKYLITALVVSIASAAYSAPPIEQKTSVIGTSYAVPTAPPSVPSSVNKSTINQEITEKILTPGNNYQQIDQHIGEKKDQAINSYVEKKDEAITDLSANKDINVYVVTPRGDSRETAKVYSYYAVLPNDEVVTVNSSVQGADTVKTVAVFAPNEPVPIEAVEVYIPHSEAKAAIAYKEGKGTTPERVEVAVYVAENRGEVHIVSETSNLAD